MAGAAQPYPATLLEHFRTPRNAGRLEPGPGVVESLVGARAQGIEVRLGIRFEHGRAVAVRFAAYGCPWTIAGASWLTEAIRGRTVATLAQLGWRDIVDALVVPPEKYGRMLVLEDALRTCLRSAEEQRATV